MRRLWARSIPPAARIAWAICLALALTAVTHPLRAQQRDESFITGSGARHWREPSAVEETLQLAVHAGLLAAREEVNWAETEQERGKLAVTAETDFYLPEEMRHGIAPLVILTYGNKFYDGGDKPRSAEAIAAFTRYAEFLARHFLGKVHSYELWNEWSNNVGGGTPGSTDDYVRLLKSVSPALKAIDPHLKLLMDEVVMGRHQEGDFQKLAQLGVLRLGDGISVHPYAALPEDSLKSLQDTEAALRRSNDGAPVPLYVTEIGWHTDGRPDGVSLERQAGLASRILLLARTAPFIKGVWLYNFRNNGWDLKDNEQNYGLLWLDDTPKPAYYAVGDVTAALADATFVDRLSTVDDQDWVLRFRTSAGQDLWAVWTAKDGVLSRFALETLATSPSPVELHEAGRPPVTRSWIADPQGHGISRLDVIAGETPILLRGNLSDVVIHQVGHPALPSDRR